jgi:hypothetical protein
MVSSDISPGFCGRVHNDGASVSIRLPKGDEGLINNKQDAFSFKVRRLPSVSSGASDVSCYGCTSCRQSAPPIYILHGRAYKIAQYDGVMENANQESVYTTAASEVVDSVLAGFSGCVFAYGQV